MLAIVPAAAQQSHSARRHHRLARPLCLGLTALIAGATAGCSYVMSPTSATSPAQLSSSAPPPPPMAVATARVPSGEALDSPSPLRTSDSGGSAGSGVSGGSGAASSSVQDYEGSLILDASGAQMATWNKTASYCPENSGNIANGTVGTDSTGAVNLTTTGKAGSCVALISPGSYASDVIEADIYFPGLPGSAGTMANWTGFWLTDGATWPEGGELDGVEVEPVNAANAVTWHSGTTSNEFSASTSGFSPVQLPVDGANLSPGWHVVDMVYTRGFFAVYYDGQEFTSYTSSNVTGSPLNVYVTMTNTPNTAAIVDKIGSPPINSDPSSATLSVRYLKVWSLR
jgi:hypothetical protein